MISLANLNFITWKIIAQISIIISIIIILGFSILINLKNEFGGLN